MIEKECCSINKHSTGIKNNTNEDASQKVSALTDDDYDEIFDKLMNKINYDISLGKAFSSDNLIFLYKNLCKDESQTCSDVDADWIYTELVRRYSSKLKLVNLCGSGPNLVVSKSLDLLQEINFAAHFKNVTRKFTDKVDDVSLSSMSSEKFFYLISKILAEKLTAQREIMMKAPASQKLSQCLRQHLNPELFLIFYWLISSNDFKELLDVEVVKALEQDTYEKVLRIILKIMQVYFSKTLCKTNKCFKEEISQKSDLVSPGPIVTVLHNGGRYSVLLPSAVDLVERGKISLRLLCNCIKEAVGIRSESSLIISKLNKTTGIFETIQTSIVNDIAGSELMIRVTDDQIKTEKEEEVVKDGTCSPMETEQHEQPISSTSDSESSDDDSESAESDDKTSNAGLASSLVRKTRRRPLPTPYRVPIEQLSESVRRVAMDGHRPLKRSDTIAVTSVLFADITQYVLYPSPEQYDDIVQALLRALPGLARAHNLPPREIHNLWRTRLQYKFRNNRKRIKRKEMLPALPRAGIRHWKTASNRLIDGERLYDASELPDAAADAEMTSTASLSSDAAHCVSALAEETEGDFKLMIPKVSRVCSAEKSDSSLFTITGLVDLACQGTQLKPKMEPLDSSSHCACCQETDRAHIKVSFGSKPENANRQVTVCTKNLSPESLTEQLRTFFGLDEDADIGVAVFDENMRIFRPLLPKNVEVVIADRAQLKVFVKPPRKALVKDKFHYLVEEGLIDPALIEEKPDEVYAVENIEKSDDDVKRRRGRPKKQTTTVNIRSCLQKCRDIKSDVRRLKIDENEVNNEEISIDNSNVEESSSTLLYNKENLEMFFDDIRKETEEKAPFPGSFKRKFSSENKTISHSSIKRLRNRIKQLSANATKHNSTSFSSNKGEFVKCNELEQNRKPGPGDRQLELKEPVSPSKADEETLRLCDESEFSFHADCDKNIADNGLKNCNWNVTEDEPLCENSCGLVTQSVTPLALKSSQEAAIPQEQSILVPTPLFSPPRAPPCWPAEYRFPRTALPAFFSRVVGQAGPKSRRDRVTADQEKVNELLTALTAHCLQYTSRPTQAQCAEAVGALFASVPELPRLEGLTPHRSFSTWNRRLLEHFGYEASDVESDMDTSSSPVKYYHDN